MNGFSQSLLKNSLQPLCVAQGAWLCPNSQTILPPKAILPILLYFSARLCEVT